MKKTIAVVAIFVASSAFGQAVTVNGNLSFNPTTNGIAGTTAGDNASPGNVGEFLSAQVLKASSVSLTSGVSSNITSVVLTPGDWDVSGVIIFNPAGTTTQTLLLASLSTTSGTIPPVASPTVGGAIVLDYTVPSGIGVAYPVPTARFNVTTNTTVYLVANNTFSGGANGGYGYVYARRMR